MCLKVNQVPQRDNVRDLEPSTTECDLIWKEGLKRCSQDEVIMGYLIQYDLCPHIENNEKKKKKKLDTVTGMERGKTANGCREKVM